MISSTFRKLDNKNLNDQGEYQILREDRKKKPKFLRDRCLSVGAKQKWVPSSFRGVYLESSTCRWGKFERNLRDFLSVIFF